ncbi:MAG TPA: transcriptional repressor [Clostridia bacterium]|nr:transcriptional repressor [Clostridia bacterium]
MGKRTTIQKQLVLDAVVNLASHPTADDVYNEVILKYSNISKGTVYRNLNSLVDDDQLRRISVPDAADRFDATNKPHYHIKCKKCEVFYDIDTPYISEIDTKIADIIGFELEGHDIVFKGICPKCK